MFNDKVILITGGTGSFGQAFVKWVTSNYNPQKIIIFSRDEMKQWEMAKSYEGNKAIRFFIGDIRDRDRVYRAFDGVNIIIHAAATKIVPTAEYNPFECIKTNVIGAMNLIDAAIDKGVDKVVALSTDKASSPINLYGASKLASDKLFVAANAYSNTRTKFSVVRYGNVMGSRGSVIPLFLSLSGKGKIPITDFRMTRFMITLDEGISLVKTAFEDMRGGEIYVKKIPSMKVVDIARSLAPDDVLEKTGIRPGEKIHEQMIGLEDAMNTYEYDDYFKIIPQGLPTSEKERIISGGTAVPEDFIYASDSNDDWMSKDDLIEFVKANNKKFLTI
jgi:UDP-N-acetylglucosamine 4,6-dehydratase/5-epimerase